MKRILYNAIVTPDGTTLESKHRHDYVCHTDKNGLYYAVDGGCDYLKRSCEGNYAEASIYDDGNHELRREHVKWGVNYTKEMEMLPRTKWTKIKDLNTEHIKAIIDGGYVAPNSFYNEVFEEELKYRL